MLVTLMMGGLFVLKFTGEATQTEYALKIKVLIDETSLEGAIDWDTRRRNFFEALDLMAQAKAEQIDLDKVLEKATAELDLPDAYKRVLHDSLLLNLNIAIEMELLTEENFAKLDAGELLMIGAGGFNGEDVVLGNTVPHSYSPELEMRFANLLLKPQRVARRYPNEMGEGAMAMMNACRSAEMMTETSYARAIQALRSGRS
ncbi:MAG: hypothetical protein ACI9UA_001029 [Pseudoalteromonas tetraodonis]|jgi:hypothetical protein